MVYLLDISSLNKFLEAIFQYRDASQRESIDFKDSFIPDIVTQLDPKEQYWHRESNVIWRKQDWIRSQLRDVAFKKQAAEERILREERNAKLIELRLAISKQFKIANNETVEAIAIEIIKNRIVEAAAKFGVDISRLVNLQTSQIIVEGKVRYEL